MSETLVAPTMQLPAMKDKITDAVTVEEIEVDVPGQEAVTPLLTPPIPSAVANTGELSPGTKNQAAFVNKLYS